MNLTVIAAFESAEREYNDAAPAAHYPSCNKRLRDRA